MQEVTGHVPRMMRYVKDALKKEEIQHPKKSTEAKIQLAIEAVETDVVREGKDELSRTFKNLEQEEKDPFVKYLGRILFPAWYHGPPKERDGKLYDKGFIYHDDNGGVLRVVHAPAHRTLLGFYISHSRVDNVVSVC